MGTVTLEITCGHSSYARIHSVAVIPLPPVGLDRNHALLLYQIVNHVQNGEMQKHLFCKQYVLKTVRRCGSRLKCI